MIKKNDNNQTGARMYGTDFSVTANTAKAKADFINKNPGGYLVASILAGVFVGIGVFLSFTIGNLLDGQPYAKILMGASFSIALSLIVIAGAELFTGSNFIMSSGLFFKTVNFRQTLRIWVICYFGNWLGSIIISAVFMGTGLASGSLGEFINAAAINKTELAFLPLFLRAVLCNTLVCLAVWSCVRCKSDSGKLIIIFWCMFAFVTIGFEHCVANMTLLSVSLMNNGIGVAAYFYNISVATFGNMAGGILFVALPYFLISAKD